MPPFPLPAVLLGRLPGCAVRAFAASDCPEGLDGEAACRAWLGLPPAAEGEEELELDPLSCLLLVHSSAGGNVYDCLDGLQAAFPRMLVTGGGGAGGAARREGRAFGANVADVWSHDLPRGCLLRRQHAPHCLALHRWNCLGRGRALLLAASGAA